jgi:hypothetical protein
MEPQDGLDRGRVHPHLGAGEAIGDPGRLGPSLELDEILLAPPPVHRHDRDEPAARHEADEQQPPLEFRHQPGRIGPDEPGLVPAYTPRR